MNERESVEEIEIETGGVLSGHALSDSLAALVCRLASDTYPELVFSLSSGFHSYVGWVCVH